MHKEGLLACVSAVQQDSHSAVAVMIWQPTPEYSTGNCLEIANETAQVKALGPVALACISDVVRLFEQRILEVGPLLGFILLQSSCLLPLAV